MELPDAYLYGIAKRLGTPSMWADDCVQCMRLALWRKDGSPSYPSQVAAQAGIDFLRQAVYRTRGDRKAPNVTSIDDMVNLHARPYPSDELLEAEDRLQRVTPQQRRILMLMARGYSMTEIGAIEHCGLSRVSQLVKAARERLAA